MRRTLLVLLCAASVHAADAARELRPPVAKAIPKTVEKHGYVWTDDYYWLWERENPEVRKYLEAENQYTAAMMAHTEGLQKKLFEEFMARSRQTDMSVPYKRDGYYYYSRIEEGSQYPLYCRKKGSLGGPEEVMVDVNKLAAGHKFCSVRPLDVSPNGNLTAYGLDTAGRRFYTIYFQNLVTGQVLKDAIPNVTGNTQWANDNKTVFYTKQHPESLRAYQVYRHALGADPARDELVYEERNESYGCFVSKTKSKKYLLVRSSSGSSTEVRYLDAGNPRVDFRLFLAAQKGHEYYVDHYQDHFYIRTNLGAKNFRLMKTPVTRTAVTEWTEVIPARNDVLLEDIQLFRDHLVVTERTSGLLKLRIMPWSGPGEHYVDFGEQAYSVYPAQNYEFDTPVVRYRYTSMTTPMSVYDYNMATREKKLLKREVVLGGFESSHYQTERLEAPTPDGTRVPITLIYRKGFRRDGRSPLLLYGYGAYGVSGDASFDPFRISLLDRGFVYAIAHVRGGGDLGRDWHDQGRLLNKKNTFTDFIACADYLVKERYADARKMFAEGVSAGGLLVGVVANLRAGLFKGILARVPWTDVLTESASEGAPADLTENDEWGDLNDKKCFEYIRSYSPYHNVRSQDYPHILATTSFQDSLVSYWSPAKWIARLRATGTGRNRLLLKTTMEGGHSGASGRFDRYRDTAFQYAFLLDLAGVRE